MPLSPQLRGSNPVAAENLEAVLALLGMYSHPGQLMHPRFAEISTIGSTTSVGYQFAGVGTVSPSTPTSFGVDTLRLVPFFVPKTIHIDRLAFVVTTVGGAGSKGRVGLYNSQQQSPFLPTTLIVDGGEFDTNVLNGQIATVDVTLQGGTIYWAAYLCGVGAPSIIAPTSTHNEPYLGYQITAASAVVTGINGLVLNQAYGALPNVLPTALATYSANGNSPGVFFRIN